ncbi:MAG: hypothetical protein JRE28_01475 [Deltaproteobacteria bacterium]|nr:hypothetical protein [Deltaproteobacteria bacterium]
MDKKINHSLLTFCRSLLHGICFNDKRHRLITFKGVIISIILISTTLCNGSDQNPETLKQLIDLYDPIIPNVYSMMPMMPARGAPMD